MLEKNHLTWLEKKPNKLHKKVTILERGPSNMIIHTGKHKTTQYIIHLPHQHIRKNEFPIYHPSKFSSPGNKVYTN